MDELLQRIPDGGAWTVLVVVLLLIFGPVRAASREGAERLWLFGRVARWLAERQERSVARERRIRSDTVSDLREDLARLRSDLDLEQERARKRDEDSRRREDRLNELLADALDYITYSTAWARRVMRLAAEHGWHPPVDEWQSFDEWKSSRRR